MRGAPDIDIFLAYWYQDEDLKRGLEEHLALLQQEGRVNTWHSHRIDASWQPHEDEDEHVRSAQIILFLISSSFLSSRYLLESEASLALERHRNGEALCVPVLLRPCQWQSTPLGELVALPNGANPVTLWESEDLAFLDITTGLRRHIETLRIDTELEPTFTNETTRKWARELEMAHVLRAQAAATGSSTAQFDDTIQLLKSQLRQGGELQPGDILGGRFRLLQVVAEGNLSQVWRAYDRQQQQVVALKALQSRFRRDRHRQELFLHSARQMARLSDIDGVIQVIESQGRDGDISFQVQEYLAGGDFRQRVLEGGLSTNQRLEVIFDVGEALTAAHRLGVVHRDVRPSNILFDLEGHPKLINFERVSGADAAQASKGAVRNKFLHVAPEAMTHGDVAAPADVYGLGMTTLFALHGADIPPALMQSLQQLMAGLQVPEACPPVIEKALAWKAEDRWSTIREYTDALHQSFIPIRHKPQESASAGEKSEDKTRAKAQSIVVPRGPQGKPEGISFGFRPQRSARRLPVEASQGSSGLLWLGGILVALVALFLSTRGPSTGDTIEAPIEDDTSTVASTSRDCAELARAKGIDMLYIAGGLFTLGTDAELAVYGGNPGAVGRSQPEHTVRLSPFWISTYAVTNEQYDRFVQEAGYNTPKLRTDSRFDAPRQPVVGVSWQDASQFAEWAEMELPSEAQWEAAARGPDGSLYPWGNQAPTPRLANYGGVELATVDAHPDGTGPYGTQGQAGGVWEWCQDTWNERAYGQREGAVDPVSEYGNASRRVARGGSWMNDEDNLPSAVRIQFSALAQHRENVGFRVVCRPSDSP